jgi:hypothetical protein
LGTSDVLGSKCIHHRERLERKEAHHWRKGVEDDRFAQDRFDKVGVASQAIGNVIARGLDRHACDQLNWTRTVADRSKIKWRLKQFLK